MKTIKYGVVSCGAWSRINRAIVRGAIGFAILLVLRTPAAFSQFTIGRNFTGTSLSQEPGLPGSGGSEAIPPDTIGAVGPSNIVETLNGSFAVYSKTGAVQSHVSLNSFWNTAFSNSGAGTTTSSTFDPRILYDPFSNRWYATALDNGGNANSRFLVAVTTDGNPSPANWRGFAIKSDPTSTRWADYDTIGLDASGLFISANMFAISSGSSAVNFVGIPKSSLNAATPSIAGMVMQQGVSGSGGSLQTAVDLSNSGLPDPTLSASSGHVKRNDVPSNFFSSMALTTSGPSITVPAFPSAPQAHQPGPNDNIETGDERLDGNVVLQNGHLWGAHGVSVNGRAAVQWFEINRSNNALLQSGVISDPTKDLYFPSIAVNSADAVVMGFSGSDDNTPVGTYAVAGTTKLGATTFGPITELKPGNGSYFVTFGGTSNRWGDYSATVIDPSNSNSFWTFQEFANGTNNWGVQVTQILVPEPAAVLTTLIGLATCLAYFDRRRRTFDELRSLTTPSSCEK